MFASPVVEVAGLVAALATVAPLDLAGDDGRSRRADLTDAELVDLIRALEETKAAAAAAQARATARLAASQRAAQRAAGVCRDRIGAGIAAQVALARRTSHHRGTRDLGLAEVLVHEMPHTLRALGAGVLTEWRATLLARETACLSLEDRQVVDAHMAGDTATLEALGDRELVAAARRIAYELDPHSVVDRNRRAAQERAVTLRPAPDTMAYLTALLPVADAVAAYAALGRAADSHRGSTAAGRAETERRSRGQVMADTLLERLTGRSHAEPVPVEVCLVMTDRTLLADDDEPATLLGYGTVPADYARYLTAAAADADHAWYRRLYTAPTTGRLLASDSRATHFGAGLARHLRARDHAVCRTPWCDSPVRHSDHVSALVDGGPTTTDNGQSLCEACNYAKQALDWRARCAPGPRHTVELTTPTGHTYHSTAPPPPGAGRHATFVT
ncbi:HNH endonuclease [Nocardioides sp. Leaf374]|uniref:HNH endonuclease n=1 Tax=Nocardioides sp. Leaf374 TaxID=2876560 RepID=UPI001E46C2EE|nr:DUF222 domain-containing protein [Nocardioides sp. Leaf374]